MFVLFIWSRIQQFYFMITTERKLVDRILKCFSSKHQLGFNIMRNFAFKMIFVRNHVVIEMHTKFHRYRLLIYIIKGMKEIPNESYLAY